MREVHDKSGEGQKEARFPDLVGRNRVFLREHISLWEEGGIANDSERVLRPGAELAQMRLAERQVLEAVEELQRVWKAQGRQSPVLYTSSRIKSPESMCRKLAQRGQPQTRQAALTRVRDAVGVRVICGFQDDVYQVARWLEDQAAFSVLETKDYISYPKENGYRSYHLILGLRAGPGRGMTVEVQLRTIAIDFWASLEHQLKYKRQVPHARLVREELRRCADEIASVDLSMETIRELLAGSF